MRWIRTPLLLPAAVFLGLVLVPSLLLGWFSLRAVENERAAAHRRLLSSRPSGRPVAGQSKLP